VYPETDLGSATSREGPDGRGYSSLPVLPSPGLRTRFVAAVARDGTSLRSLVEDEPFTLPPGESAAPGSVVLARRAGEHAQILVHLAAPDTALAELHAIGARFGVDVAFSDAVMDEVERVVRAPRLGDPALVDLEALPFVTIDSAGAKDLDQAVHVESARGGGWLVRYAIADAGSYVPRGSALWDEALRRGASYYLPGLSIPMLPRALSEGIVSLNPDGPRRALVFAMHVDAHGRQTGTELVRARIRSRAKLSWDDVQALFDAPASSPLSGSDMEASLRAMAEVGRARLREAAERDVVRYRRREVEVALTGAAGERFVVLDGVRREVELWNEQISLLCNAEGARLLAETDAPFVQPIYRVHPPPDEARVEGLRAAITSIAAAHGLPLERWRWTEGEALAVYVASLPLEGPHARVARAIQRQAIMTNVRSRYATEPGTHHGVGFEPYARFSAPMREVVGVYLHAEALQMLEGRGETSAEAEALRAKVVESANRSKDVQRAITDLVNRRVIDRLFEGDLAHAPASRPLRRGTVMGVQGGKLHVQLDEPGIDVKVYLYDLAQRWGGVWLEADEAGVVLRERESGKVRAVVGDAIELRVVKRDPGRDRWVLEAVTIGQDAERA
jgi:ribonuclease R